MSASTIVHITTFLQGGAGRTVADLACAQRARGHRVVVAASATAEPGFESYSEYLATLAAAGIEVVLADSSFKRDLALNDAMASAVLDRLKGDVPMVIHAHAAIPSLVGRRIASAIDARDAIAGTVRRAVPVVQTMHGWSLKKRAEHAAQDLKIMASIDEVVFPSAASARQLLDLGATLRNWRVVPAGIERYLPCQPLPPSLQPVVERRRQGSRVLVTIGSLTAQKNHAVAIDALPSILEAHDVDVVLAGEGPEMGPLRARAEARGVGPRVHCLGYVPSASAVLDIADLLVQPSLTESFGIAVVEAFRARVPVVVSDVPALAELVTPEDIGWRFDPQRPDALAAAVCQALALGAPEREAMLDRAEARFHRKYTLDRMVAGYDAVYRDRVGRDARGARHTAAGAHQNLQVGQ